MRASPAVEVTLTRFGAWQAGMGVLAFASASCVLAWWATQHRLPPVGAGMAAAAVLCALGWLLLPLVRVPHARLRWDGRGWQLRPTESAAGSASAEAVAGELAVAMDLGAWMLLRFEPLARARWATPVWLPVQRAGIEPQWHALRCAVYSPRPAPAAEATPP